MSFCGEGEKHNYPAEQEEKEPNKKARACAGRSEVEPKQQANRCNVFT